MPESKSPIILSSLCLRYLLILRTIAMGGQVVALLAAHLLLSTPLPIAPIAAVLTALALFTIVSWRRLPLHQPVSEHSILRQLFVDIAALAVLLYFTGGSWNPFVSLFMLPVTVAAATLRPAYTWLVVGCATASYTVLMFFHRHTLHWVHEDDHFSLHLWGMWFGFLISAGIVAYFVARIGATLRAHDRALAEAREKALQARQLIALGSLAAGTAHELGTPLATMAVLAGELENDHEDETVLLDGLHLLRGQLDRCKEILSRMAAQAGEARAHTGGRVHLDDYLRDLVAEWRGLRPDATAAVVFSGISPAPSIIADRTLTQAIMNVFNNAADASPDRVEIEGRWDDSELHIAVRDHGAGLPREISGHLGGAFVTTKDDGMGLGLYLARTTLDRLGGRVRLRERNECGGVAAEIVLPLAPLLAA